MTFNFMKFRPILMNTSFKPLENTHFPVANKCTGECLLDFSLQQDVWLYDRAHLSPSIGYYRPDIIERSFPNRPIQLPAQKEFQFRNGSKCTRIDKFVACRFCLECISIQ